jgi:hypothetical protein
MKRNHGKRFRYDGNYRADLLLILLDSAGFKSAYALAKHLGLNVDTTYNVFKGIASYKQVRRIAEFFGVPWAMLHELNLPLDDLHRAVLNGNSRSVR